MKVACKGHRHQEGTQKRKKQGTWRHNKQPKALLNGLPRAAQGPAQRSQERKGCTGDHRNTIGLGCHDKPPSGKDPSLIKFRSIGEAVRFVLPTA